MIIDTDDYMNIATFARHIGRTAVRVNQLLKLGRLDYILISGIKFINYKEYGKENGSGENQDEGCPEEREQCSEAEIEV